jgi:hypothetical protein
MIKRHQVKSCCGKSNIIIEIPVAIRKHHVVVFEGAGYMAPQSHKDIGVFYVRRPGLVATAVYGARKITIYCSDRNCDRVISDFEKLLESAISS